MRIKEDNTCEIPSQAVHVVILTLYNEQKYEEIPHLKRRVGFHPSHWTLT